MISHVEGSRKPESLPVSEVFNISLADVGERPNADSRCYEADEETGGPTKNKARDGKKHRANNDRPVYLDPLSDADPRPPRSRR